MPFRPLSLYPLAISALSYIPFVSAPCSFQDFKLRHVLSEPRRGKLLPHPRGLGFVCYFSVHRRVLNTFQKSMIPTKRNTQRKLTTAWGPEGALGYPPGALKGPLGFPPQGGGALGSLGPEALRACGLGKDLRMRRLWLGVPCTVVGWRCSAKPVYD